MNVNFTVKVISEGRITIPDEIRKLTSVKEGDFVELRILGVHKATGRQGA
jgi:AbrB family looped-hinge helix DNA binding protein